MTAPLNIHASGLVLSAKGVLVRGPSGAGKSLLALDLIDYWTATGRSADLVGDDRLDIGTEQDRLCMSPPPPLAGLIELRGRGIVRRPYRASAPVDLIVDLVAELDRMPAPKAFATVLLGHTVPRCPVPDRAHTDPVHQRLLVSEAIAGLAAYG